MRDVGKKYKCVHNSYIVHQAKFYCIMKYMKYYVKIVCSNLKLRNVGERRPEPLPKF